jgi:hypothetical protein
MTLPFGAFNGDMARMANFGQWAGYFPTYTMTLNPNAKTRRLLLLAPGGFSG